MKILKKILIMTIVAMGILLLIGCEQPELNPNGSGDSQTEAKQFIVLAYVNEAYTENTMNSNVPAITLQTLYEESEGDGKYLEVVSMLQEGAMPLEEMNAVRQYGQEVQPDETKTIGAATSYKDTYKINSIEVNEKKAVVDFSAEGLTGTALDEALLISQITETLVGTFEEIEYVEFTIDGQKIETLMGNINVDKGFSKSLFISESKLREQAVEENEDA